MPAAADLKLYLMWRTLLTLLLTVKLADGNPSMKDLGECLSEEVCKANGGVKGYDCDSSRCPNIDQSESGGDENYVYCTTFSHLAKNLCSIWLPLWNEHDDNCRKTSRIISGMNTEEGEFKHVAAVGRWSSQINNIMWMCGGTLITPYFVLTAAHCVDNKYGVYYVRLGEHDFRQISSDSIKGIKMDLPDYLHRSFEYRQTMKESTLIKQTLKVKKVIMYPKYRRASKYYDVALLELETAVVLNKNVLPACLPFNNETDSLIGMQLTVAGWGATQNNAQNRLSPIMKKVTVPVVDAATCDEINLDLIGPFQTLLNMTPELLCAGEAGLDSCKGDSGGPLGRIVSQENYKCGFEVFGIVSRGYQCGYMGIYSRISSYLNWIMRYLSLDHYHNHIMEQINSNGIELDGKSSIEFKIKNHIFTNGYRIQIDFKTGNPSGTFIAIVRKGSFLMVGIQDGKIIFRESLAGVYTITRNSYNNSEWHRVDVECTPTTGHCFLKTARETSGDVWTLPSEMEMDTDQTMSLGGYTGAREYYKGCLMYSLESSFQLEAVHSSHGTINTCNSNRPQDNTATTSSTKQSSCSQIKIVSTTTTTMQPDITTSTTEESTTTPTSVSTTTTTMQPDALDGIAYAAQCMPERVTVDLDVRPSKKIIYIPTCVRLRRCGGCCTSQLLECQPTKVEILSLKVLKVLAHKRGSHRKPGSRRRSTRFMYEVILQEDHVECNCQCKVQEKHCDPLLHNYYPSRCACVCKNEEEQRVCEGRSHHYWDNNQCSCK